jgi:serine/threonine protein kinase
MNKEQQELKNFLNQLQGTIQQKKRYLKKCLEQIQDYGYESDNAEKQKLEKILELIQIESLSNNYRKKNMLGKGNVGQVYLMQNLENPQKQYAYKRNLKKHEKKLTYQAQLLKQVNKRVPSKSNLKYIQHGNNILITEYLKGFVQLNDFLIISPEKCSEIVPKVNIAVDELHKAGIAHRDLKGENIMINPETLEIKIIDFGVGCIKDSSKFNCRDFIGTTPKYYPQYQQHVDFQDWTLGDKKALDILWNELCDV